MSVFAHSTFPAGYGRSLVGARIRSGSAKVRRMTPRRCRRSRLPIRVLTTSGSHCATVAGVTLYGACLDGGRKLRRREIIALQLPSGWRIKARVCWRLGRRCGIKFMTPVAEFARLLSEGAVIYPPIRYRLLPVDPRDSKVAWTQPLIGDATWLLRRATAAAQALSGWIFAWRSTPRAARISEPPQRSRTIDCIGTLPPLP